jgi:hypothetical protein
MEQRYICQMIEKIDEQINALSRIQGAIEDLAALQEYKDAEWGAVKSRAWKIAIDYKFIIEVLSNVKTDYKRRIIELG